MLCSVGSFYLATRVASGRSSAAGGRGTDDHWTHIVHASSHDAASLLCGAEAPIASGRRRRPVRAPVGLADGCVSVNGKSENWTDGRSRADGTAAPASSGETVAPGLALLR